MKTFDEIRGTAETEDLNESRLLRKGGALLFARSAKKHGDDAHKSFNDAKQKIKGNPLDTDGERLTSLQDGMMNLCDGLISLRKQNGAITGIMTTAVLLNERTSHQLEKIIKHH